jgi:hypothetical protein
MTFRADVETCPRCGSAMTLLELCTDPDSIRQAFVRQGLGPMPHVLEFTRRWRAGAGGQAPGV